MKKLTFAAVAVAATAMFMSCGNSTPKANLKSEIDTVSYAMGVMQGQSLKEYVTRVWASTQPTSTSSSKA